MHYHLKENGPAVTIKKEYYMVNTIISRGMERLIIAVQELSLARNMDTVMKIVRKVARELTGADGATFVLRDGDLCFYADEDAITPPVERPSFSYECVHQWLGNAKSRACTC